MSPETITLKSGRVLAVSPSPFRVAEALNDALMDEGSELQKTMPGDLDVKAMLSRVILKGFSSKRIKSAIWDCFPKAMLDKKKLTEDLFEDVAMREDYYIVCYHVAEVNVRPFIRNLESQFADVFRVLTERVQSSTSEKKTSS